MALTGLLLSAPAWGYGYLVSWTAPTQRVDGSPLTNLARYDIYRGPCAVPLSLSKVASVNAPATSVLVEAPLGAYCWDVVAVDAAGRVSAASNVVAFHPATDTDGDGVIDAADNCRLVANAGQVDSDADGFGNRCDGDLNGNGFTNAQDYILFRQALGVPSPAPVYHPADFNANGFINAQDYVIFQQLLGLPPSPSP